MLMSSLHSRVWGKYHRTLASLFCRRMVPVKTAAPIISFSFDDVPKTALSTGGQILVAHGIKATYYVSLGLLGSETEVGTIASADDLAQALKEGHELGCHTFDHLDAWETTTETFLESVAKNQLALNKIIPGAMFKTFAYPKSGAKLAIKPHLQQYFTCCRGGGQAANVGATDFNLLRACFLDQRTKIDMNSVRNLIDYITSCPGWLIFATHDVTHNPSPYGITPEFFAEVVEYAASSSAFILPVAEAAGKLQGTI